MLNRTADILISDAVVAADAAPLLAGPLAFRRL